MTIGQRFKQTMKEKGYTQVSLGEALGSSQTAIGRVCNDKGFFEFSLMIKACELLDISLDYLVYGHQHDSQDNNTDTILQALSGRVGHDKAELDYYLDIVKQLERVEQDEVYTTLISEADKAIRLVLNRRTMQATIIEEEKPKSKEHA